MDPRNGFGFLSAGVWMWLWPQLAPGRFPAPAWGGANGRALWLEGMGLIELAIGAAVVLRFYAVPTIRRWSAARKAAGASPSFALARMRGLIRL